MRELGYRVLLLLLAIGIPSHAQQTLNEAISTSTTSNDAQSTSQPASKHLTGSTTSSPTCPSRTANYITHTLAQQCLRTDRAAANATQGSVTQHESGAKGTLTLDDSSSSPVTGPTTLDQAAAGHLPTASETATHSSSPTINDQSGSATVASSDNAAPSLLVDESTNTESDSPFDNANFLSFEEWKMQNLAKAGQNPEHLGQGHGQHFDGHRQRPGINNALDGLGEENEIELDFAGFGGAAKASSQPEATVTAQSTIPESGNPTPQALRSKDAGKTCKERTNYASFDCAATILKTNPQCKSASSVLVENKDSYMLNPCSADNKFVIVELCNDILIDTIVLANYEFFSSIFRQFRVSVSDRYPVKMEKWKHLGTFEARSTREVQAFLIENPLIWARYLRIEFLSHYGSEYYCPLSLLRVHGTTMLEEFRHQEELARGEHDDESVVTLEAEVVATPPVAQEPEISTDESVKPTIQSISQVDEVEASTASQPVDETSTVVKVPSEIETAFDRSPEPPTAAPSNLPQVSEEFNAANATESTEATYSTAVTHMTNGSAGNSVNSTAVHSEDLELNVEKPPGPSFNDTTSIQSSTSLSSASHSDSETASPTSHGEARPTVTEPSAQAAAGATTSLTSISTISSSHDINSTSDASAPTIASSETKHADINTDPRTKSSALARSVVTPVSAPPAQPSTQESFFKSIHKRLQQLESNSTLSLQYIEEQSRILRDAFSKVEKRQLTSTSNFLTHLNETVMAELHGFRQAYDQIWQSTVLELESQREATQREMLALSSRLTLVADELVWQKRMGIAQSTLLLLCLGLVLFARNGTASIDIPLYRQVRNRSQAALARAGWDTPPPASPSPKSRSPVDLLRKRIWRAATEPLGGANDTEGSRPESQDGLEVDVIPPTPPSSRGKDERSSVRGESDDVARDSDGSRIEGGDVFHHRTRFTDVIDDHPM